MARKSCLLRIEGILHFDRLCHEDRSDIQPMLDELIENHDLVNGKPVLDPDPKRFAVLKPPPLPRRGWMPPKIQEFALNNASRKKGGGKKNNKSKKPAASGGFGGGGFGKSK